MANRTTRVPETSLYGTAKTFLESHGFEVKGEVYGCDIVAVRDGQPPMLVITELKMAFTLELLLQGVDRLRAVDEGGVKSDATLRSGAKPNLSASVLI
jgi:hypothetical protein